MGTNNNDEMYYEIEYDASPIPGVGKYVQKAQKIEAPQKDEVRDIFVRMRDIARVYRAGQDFSRFFDRRSQQLNAQIFYKQGLFMQDFTDDYVACVIFSQYFPHYQIMGYEQLRTYFTWRTNIRKGIVADISISYAFLYIYELLANIGVSDPQEGLDKLVFFWKAFRVHRDAIDSYVVRWLKDYHVYYELPRPFHTFIKENGLAEFYPSMAEPNDDFSLFCAMAKYDIRKSAFFTEDRTQMITDCFYAVVDKLRRVFAENGLDFDAFIFRPTKNMSVWTPFRDALFYPWAEQSDRQVVLSKKEMYHCRDGGWLTYTAITTESGKQFIGYILKQMESALRQVTRYKYKLSANIYAIEDPEVRQLREDGKTLEDIVFDTVLAFYREATKTVVTVDEATLSAIRREAFETQEKLIVPEQAESFAPVLPPPPSTPALPPLTEPVSVECDVFIAPQSGSKTPWQNLKNALTEVETEALAVVLRGDMPIKVFADAHGMMAEVLADGINEKAMDHIGDNLMDEDFALYDDYRAQVGELIQ